MKSKHKEEIKNSTANSQAELETIVALDEEEEMIEVLEDHQSSSGLEVSDEVDRSAGKEKSAPAERPGSQKSKTLEKSAVKAGLECLYCEKRCANGGNLKQHMMYKHKEEVEKAAQSVEQNVVTSNVGTRKSRRRSISNNKNKTSASRKQN